MEKILSSVLTSYSFLRHNASMTPDTHSSVPSGTYSAEAGFVSRTMLVIGLSSVAVIIALALAGYFYFQYQHSQSQLASPSAKSDQEVQQLVAAVGKLIELPQGEQPTIATVSDVNKLKSQPFFVHAKNGDKVLIYTKAQKAILYDPTEQKIVDVGPINLTQASPTPAHQPTSMPVSVALYNGTTVTGLTGTVEKQLAISEPNVTVVAKVNANKATYTKTIVVDLTGKHAASAKSLAKDLSGVVGSLPAGELKPAGADIVVILGKK